MDRVLEQETIPSSATDQLCVLGQVTSTVFFLIPVVCLDCQLFWTGIVICHLFVQSVAPSSPKLGWGSPAAILRLKVLGAETVFL